MQIKHVEIKCVLKYINILNINFKFLQTFMKFKYIRTAKRENENYGNTIYTWKERLKLQWGELFNKILF